MCTSNSQCPPNHSCSSGVCVENSGLPHPPVVPIKPKDAIEENEDDRES